MITNYNNYLFTKTLNLDTEALAYSSEYMYKLIEENFIGKEEYYNGQATMTTKLYNQYNVLMYPLPGYYELYTEIVKAYREFSGRRDNCYMQAWLNVYQKGEFIDWHTHWPAEKKVWHGFYCLDVEHEPSYTSYRIPGEREFKIESKNNLLVIGKSEDDKHRSSEWNHETPRITIGFDIVPWNQIDPSTSLNHWIPV